LTEKPTNKQRQTYNLVGGDNNTNKAHIMMESGINSQSPDGRTGEACLNRTKSDFSDEAQ